MSSATAGVTVSVILVGMVAAWFILMKMLFNRLERLHPVKYEKMGRPTLFLRNNISSSWASLKFLLVREHRHLNDNYLSKLSDSMLVFFVVYLFLLFSFFLAGQVASQYPPI